MGALFAYSIAAGIMLTLLYLIARLALGRQTFHTLSRWSLLACLAISLMVAGLLMIDTHAGLPGAIEIPATTLPDTITNLPLAVSVPVSGTSLWLQILIILYVAGAGICAIRFLMSAIYMQKIIRSGRPDGNFGQWKVLRHSASGLSSCSWGRYILLHDNEDYDLSVMIHESAHLDQKHWIDLIVMEFAAILLWYWPTVWLIRRDLSEIHEYQADAKVIDSGIDARTYQLMLLKKAAGSRFHSIACSLNNHSNISKRIKMMLQKKSRPAVRLRVAWIVPAVALGIGVLCSPLISSALDTVSEAKVTNFFTSAQTEVPSTPAPDSHIITIRDRSGADIKGAEKISIVIVDGVRKPYSELKNLPEDNIVNINVLKDGAAKEYLTDEDTKAGKTTVILVQTNNAPKVRVRNRSAANDKEVENSTVVIIDGKRSSYSVMKRINQGKIERLTVLKDDSGVSEYLTDKDIKDGKTSVIVIKTKPVSF